MLTRAKPKLQRQKRYQRKKAAEVADIGDIPAVVDPARREACRLDLFAFLVNYYPASTGLRPFSDDHRRVIKRIELCVLHGGRFIEAVFRGWAKTTICQNGLQWATLYGHRRFAALFGADAKAAAANIASIKTELAENDLLLADFPEVCHPIRCLEGKPQRCASQTYQGKLTHIRWTSDAIVLPTIAGSVASGAILSAKGITAASRGLTFKRADGTQQRPDLALIDDPQTDESARSPSQVENRISLIQKNILRLGGHHTAQMACVICGTVIEKDDLVDQFLDAKKHPSWQGERIGMVRKWADTHTTLWLDEYARVRTTFDADTPGSQLAAHAAATAFYRENREKMDAGAEVSWVECYNPDNELSAIQHAYNLLIDDGSEVFESECQNRPGTKAAGDEQLEPEQVRRKTTTLPRGVVPAWVTHLTAFIDVQDKLLYGGVCGFRDGFRAHIIDYCTMPDQARSHFAYRDAKKTLQRHTGATSLAASLHAGLTLFTEALLGRRWKREDGAEIGVNLCLIDAGDGDHADTIYEFCRRSKFAAILLPSKGRGVTASQAPWETFRPREGERIGFHWSLAPVKGAAVRLAQIDTNYWKTFVAAGLAAPVGDSRSIETFADKHTMLAEHLTAEFGVKTQGRGRTLTEWKLRPGRDNHFLDVVVGCHAAASMGGIKNILASITPTVRLARKRSRRSVCSLAT